jgi:hypothetical protein
MYQHEHAHPPALAHASTRTLARSFASPARIASNACPSRALASALRERIQGTHDTGATGRSRMTWPCGGARRRRDTWACNATYTTRGPLHATYNMTRGLPHGVYRAAWHATHGIYRAAGHSLLAPRGAPALRRCLEDSGRRRGGPCHATLRRRRHL